MAIARLTLNSGGKIPLLGLGTYRMKPNETKAAVMAAINAGYRHIDCAYDYGNEKQVGEAIKTVIERGKVKREDLFITSKLWLTYFSPERVKRGFEKSLFMLGLDYLDLYLLHWPFALKFTMPKDMHPKDVHGNSMMDESVDYVDTYKELIKVQARGMSKAIGVSNFNEFQISRLSKESTHIPDVHQFECHPYLDQSDLLKFCQSRGIVVTGYGSLGCQDDQAMQESLFKEPRLHDIAKKYRKTVPQILLRYQIQRGISVVAKSINESHLISNAQVFDFSLDSEDLTSIKALNRDWRGSDVDSWASKEHKYYPFRKDYTE